MTAYLIGRSRRLAFIGATLGIILADIAHAIEAALTGIDAPTSIGGAGVLDTIVLAGLIGVLFAEVIGESGNAYKADRCVRRNARNSWKNRNSGKEEKSMVSPRRTVLCLLVILLLALGLSGQGRDRKG